MLEQVRSDKPTLEVLTKAIQEEQVLLVRRILLHSDLELVPLVEERVLLEVLKPLLQIQVIPALACLEITHLPNPQRH